MDTSKITANVKKLDENDMNKILSDPSSVVMKRAYTKQTKEWNFDNIFKIICEIRNLFEKILKNNAHSDLSYDDNQIGQIITKENPNFLTFKTDFPIIFQKITDRSFKKEQVKVLYELVIMMIHYKKNNRKLDDSFNDAQHIILNGINKKSRKAILKNHNEQKNRKNRKNRKKNN